MPVGVEDFKEMREQYYFIDKTRFIQELIDGHSYVTFITRPRGFGKALTMSMLYYFFTNGNTAENRKLLMDAPLLKQGGNTWRSRTRPVVFLSLKGVKAKSYSAMLEIMAAELGRFIEKESVGLLRLPFPTKRCSLLLNRFCKSQTVWYN